MSHNTRALALSSTGNFAYNGDCHQYYLKDQGTRLKLRISQSNMQKFLFSHHGRQVMLLVDIFYQGSGWYEVTSQDFENFTKVDGIPRNALPTFLRALNLFLLPALEVDVRPSYGPRDKRTQGFTRTQFKQPVTINTLLQTDKVKPFHTGTVHAPRATPSPDKLAALAARFARH